jgi:hypothetical protein
MTGVSNAMNSVQSFSQQTLRLPREWTAKGKVPSRYALLRPYIREPAGCEPAGCEPAG